MTGAPILILGAYGLAGRTIIHGLMARTEFDVIAAGRDPDRLASVLSKYPESRCQPMVLEATDSDELVKACTEAELVINAVGPYALHGAQIARVVVESGSSYIDCANEQVHYHRLLDLDPIAREKGLILVTAAGTIPGFSTILATKLIEESTSATSVDIAFSQFRHAYEGSGLASIMSGVLDAVHHPVALNAGREVPILLGSSFRDFDLPPPFGRRKMLEVPTIDTLILSERYKLNDLHSWFYLGEQPSWLFGAIRVLKPHRRKWTYNIIRKVARLIDAHDFSKAMKSGHGPEALLNIEVSGGPVKRTGSILLRDGAIPMSCLPIIIARKYLAGRTDKVGLATPLDFMDFDQLRDEAAEIILHMDIG